MDFERSHFPNISDRTIAVKEAQDNGF